MDLQRMGKTYMCQSKSPEYASCFSAHQTSVPYLSRSSVAMHLTELQLRPGTHCLGEGGVPDDVAKSLSALG